MSETTEDLTRGGRLLLALDAPSLLHRHHHARASTDLRDRGGRPAWALHGMLVQILELIEAFTPDAVVFGLDDREASARREAYPAYKAGRADKDAALAEQLDRAAPLLESLGLRAVTPPGLEADDVSASAAAWAEAHGWRCVIVTSDRDAFAHISERTHVLRMITGGGIDGSPLLTPARLHTMYGVHAESYLQFAALRGDASDNLPGVPGIGEKAAALLLAQVGSMQEVWIDLEHCGGANIAAAVDDQCVEEGRRRAGAGLVRKLAAQGSHERFDFNLEIMAGHTDVHLGLTPDVAGSPGVLPVPADRVARAVGYLGVASTTDLAVRVLAGC